jgi:hypothetical protein
MKREKNGEGKGRGRSVYKQPGTRVDRDRTTHKGGIPSERDLGTREGHQAKGKLTRGIIKGTHQGVCAMCYDIVNLYIHIVLLCVCD